MRYSNPDENYRENFLKLIDERFGPGNWIGPELRKYFKNATGDSPKSAWLDYMLKKGVTNHEYSILEEIIKELA